MGFNFGEEDARKKERLTVRLEKSLFDKLMPDNKSQQIRNILNEHFQNEGDSKS